MALVCSSSRFKITYSLEKASRNLAVCCRAINRNFVDLWAQTSATRTTATAIVNILIFVCMLIWFLCETFYLGGICNSVDIPAWRPHFAIPQESRFMGVRWLEYKTHIISKAPMDFNLSSFQLRWTKEDAIKRFSLKETCHCENSFQHIKQKHAR